MEQWFKDYGVVTAEVQVPFLSWGTFTCLRCGKTKKKQTKNKPEKTKNKKTPKTYILKGIFKIISFFPHRLAKTDLLSGMASVVKIQLLFLKM